MSTLEIERRHVFSRLNGSGTAQELECCFVTVRGTVLCTPRRLSGKNDLPEIQQLLYSLWDIVTAIWRQDEG